MRSVYVAALSDRLCKIGYSKEPDRRVLALRRAIKKPVELIWASARTPFASRIEHLAHERLMRRRGDGEWFHAPAPRVIEAVISAFNQAEEHERHMAPVRAGLISEMQANRKRLGLDRRIRMSFHLDDDDMADTWDRLKERFPGMTPSGIARMALKALDGNTNDQPKRAKK